MTYDAHKSGDYTRGAEDTCCTVCGDLLDEGDCGELDDGRLCCRRCEPPRCVHCDLQVAQDESTGTQPAEHWRCAEAAGWEWVGNTGVTR